MLRWLVGSFAVLSLALPLFAREGTVITKDGHSFPGDVTVKGDNVEVVSPGVSGPIGIKMANVEKITYVDDLSADVKNGLAKLDKRDVKSRIALAKVAAEGRAYDAARAVLLDAQAIEPANREVADLLAQVNRHLAPASQPAPGPAPAVPGPNPAPAPATRPGTEPYVAKREVTPEEINRIRQLEWRKDEPLPIKVRIDGDTKRKFVAGDPGLSAAEFAKLPPDQQGAKILLEGKPDLYPGVHVESDPATVLEFRKNVQRVIVQGCATAGCHAAGKAGSFSLVAANNDAGIYTNFLVLQKYSMTIPPKPGDPATAKGTLRFVVDRAYPDQSLLLQYMLPSELADTPHPMAPGYKGAVKAKAAPGYAQVAHWIGALSPVAPDYNIDLSKAPPRKDAKEGK